MVRAPGGRAPASGRALSRRRDPAPAACPDRAVHDHDPQHPDRGPPRASRRPNPTRFGRQSRLSRERLGWNAGRALGPTQRRPHVRDLRSARSRRRLSRLTKPHARPGSRNTRNALHKEESPHRRGFEGGACRDRTGDLRLANTTRRYPPLPACRSRFVPGPRSRRQLLTRLPARVRMPSTGRPPRGRPRAREPQLGEPA